MQIQSWSHAISRAAALLGDDELLASYLGMPLADLTAWRNGALELPARHVFTRLCALLATAPRRAPSAPEIAR